MFVIHSNASSLVTAATDVSATDWDTGESYTGCPVNSGLNNYSINCHGHVTFYDGARFFLRIYKSRGIKVVQIGPLSHLFSTGPLFTVDPSVVLPSIKI